MRQVAMDTDADFPATVIAAQYRDRKFALDRELGICTNGRGSHEQAPKSLHPCSERTQNYCGRSVNISAV
jgi:hypothetical protein